MVMSAKNILLFQPSFYEDLSHNQSGVQVIGLHITFLPSWPDGGSGG